MEKTNSTYRVDGETKALVFPKQPKTKVDVYFERLFSDIHDIKDELSEVQGDLIEIKSMLKGIENSK